MDLKVLQPTILTASFIEPDQPVVGGSCGCGSAFGGGSGGGCKCGSESGGGA